MKKTLLINLSISIGTLLICFIIGEIVVRYMGTYDVYGDFYFHEIKLKPYRLPIEATQEKTDQYLLLTSTNASTLTVIYDDLLGWSPKPNSRSEDGFFSYNSYGIRSAPTEYSISPSPNVLRIALFGDSYTHGDEVPFENTWGYYLENKLREAGIKAEVINFGVPGYGMDQAYLRWQKLGYKFSPDIVIFGLQMENTLRNTNIIRPLINNGTGYPFSKPRFILDEGKLRLLNNPAIPPQEIPQIMRDIEAWDLVRYEEFYTPEDFDDHIWFKSKLFALMEATLRERQYRWTQYFNKETWDLSKEPAQLTLNIIQNFKQSVEDQGGKFIIVRLPIRQDISTLLDGEDFQYKELLAEIDKDNDVIYPEYERLKYVFDLNLSSIDKLFTREAGGHYSAFTNELVADVIAEFIINHQVEIEETHSSN